MGLTQIKIKNFQRHEKLKVELDERVTTLVGASDVGKSAVIRALRWVCRNQPQGDAFIKDGAEGTAVQVLTDGRKICRKRSAKGENLYLLDGDEFRAFNNSVPEPIARVLCLGEINFSQQFDPPYWLSLSPGEVSRQLNAVVDLGIIDDALSAISKRVNQARATAKVSGDRLKKAKDKEAELEWVAKADEDYRAVEALQEAQGAVAVSVVCLSELVQNTKATRETRDKATSQRSELIVAGRLGQEARQVSARCVQLQSLLEEVREKQEAASREIPDISPLNQSVETYHKARQQRMALENALLEIKGAARTRDETVSGWKAAEQELHESTQGICPICGKEM